MTHPILPHLKLIKVGLKAGDIDTSLKLVEMLIKELSGKDSLGRK